MFPDLRVRCFQEVVRQASYSLMVRADSMANIWKEKVERMVPYLLQSVLYMASADINVLYFSHFS